ncbi:hypothetical protein EAF04_001026 [Stromatinia cepivora]|nr:hypothetical protein EAF04_001026 [Stromatinia cepivora]
MRKVTRGIRCTRKQQLQSKLTFHKARTKRMKKKSVMANNKLRIVTDWNVATEEVTESLPGKGQTLDGKMEDKGKGISRFEENDVSEWSSKKEEPPSDGDGPIQVFSSEEVDPRGRFNVEATKLDKYDIERIIAFLGVFYKAYNDIICYTKYHSKIEEKQVEMVDGKGGAAEGQFFLAGYRDEIMKAKDKMEGIDEMPGTLHTPKIILQRIQDGLSSLQQIWQKIVVEGQSTVTSRDMTTPIQKIEEIEKVQFIMKAIELIDGDNQSTNEKEIQGFECTHAACDDPDCYYELEAGRLHRDEDEDEEEMRNSLMDKNLSLGKESPIEESTSNWITKITGCACGTWCAGPSRS